MNKLEYKELFLFAAKAGALEGYLFRRRKVEPLINWVDSLSKMYQDLPLAVKREVDLVLSPVLERILAYGEKVLELSLREKIEQILLASSAGREKRKVE